MERAGRKGGARSSGRLEVSIGKREELARSSYRERARVRLTCVFIFAQRGQQISAMPGMSAAAGPSAGLSAGTWSWQKDIGQNRQV